MICQFNHLPSQDPLTFFLLKLLSFFLSKKVYIYSFYTPVVFRKVLSMATAPNSSEERTTEEQKQQQRQSAKEMAHKTKVIQFLGRTTPIILQNDNGPCPLLAICNVLLLKNNLNLSPDIPEVSQEKLLSLIAERLIDSNSNINNKDAGYIFNQQQNISDAIDLLPRLATGIDVNIKFRRIGDFEFTRERAIFDLLDIPLYHGWIVDPQDCETANAIGSKSYNALTGELVALESRNMEGDNKNNSEEDSMDFAAATTATLGVPFPCVSRGKSFDESPCSISNHYTRKGDMEEEAELLRVLKLSEAEMEPSAGNIFAVNNNVQTLYVNSSDMKCVTDSEPAVHVEKVETNMLGEKLKSTEQEMPILDDSSALNNHSNERVTCQTVESGAVCISSRPDKEMSDDQSISEAFVGHVCEDVAGRIDLDAAIKNDNTPLDSSLQVSPVSAGHMCNSGGDELNQRQSTCKDNIDETENKRRCCKTLGFSDLSVPVADSNSPSDRRQNIDVSEAFSSSVDDSEPIYEGEECILDSRTTGYEDREPIYEGEVVLAKQVDKGSMDTYDADSKDEITPKQGELIRNFLKNSASQLTVYGLFCLQDYLKEREICVFFRNNHFNTMFKYEGELYILATDQGYLNQPDLVWEKLNEVNGDTVYMTSIFKEFKVEDQANNTWDEQNAMDSTADYIFSIDDSDELHSSLNSDLQYAIALQRQEFDQQPRRNMQQSTITTGSKPVTGPQNELK